MTRNEIALMLRRGAEQLHMAARTEIARIDAIVAENEEEADCPLCGKHGENLLYHDEECEENGNFGRRCLWNRQNLDEDQFGPEPPIPPDEWMDTAREMEAAALDLEVAAEADVQAREAEGNL